MKLNRLYVSVAVVMLGSIITVTRLLLADTMACFSSYDFNTGKRFDFDVSQEILAETPPWLANEEFPPLSPRKAEKLARGYLPELVQQAERWTRDEIALRQMGNSDKWVYLIQFRGFHPPGIADGLVPDMRVVVLMSGEVIKPRISKYGSEKETR